MKTRQRKGPVFFTIILMLCMVLSMMVPCFATSVSTTKDSHEENGDTNDVASTEYTAYAGDDSTYNDGKFSGGNGSEKHPYEITTASELVEIASDSSFWDKSYVLMNDIDLSGVCGENVNGKGKVSWTPIGDGTNQFKGTFNGDGYKITGLYISTSKEVYSGLFGYVGEGGTVENISVGGSVTFANSTSTSRTSYVAGVVGYNLNGTIDNCYNNCSVSGSTLFDLSVGSISSYSVYVSVYVGGVVGYNSNGTIKNCYNIILISGNAIERPCSTMITRAVSANVGGIVGGNAGTIENCYNRGAVEGTASRISAESMPAKPQTYVGGIVGNNTGIVKNSYNNVTITGRVSVNSGDSPKVYSGGVVANNTGVVQNCYYLEGTNKQAIGHGTTSGNKISNVESKSTAQFTSGEVAWILQNVQADPTVQIWGQALSEDVYDKYPVLTSDPAENVRKVTFIDNGVELAVKYYNTNGPLIVPEGPTLILPSKWEMNEPDSITLEFNGGSLVTVPAGTIVLPTNSPEITLSDGGIVDKDGNIMFPQGGNVEVDGTTYTIPAGGIVKPNGSGTVSLFSSADLDKAFKITSAYLVLSQDINVNYRTTLPDNYTNPRMVFLFNGVKTVVTDYTVDELGRYCFSFTGVNPQKMGDNICATLYATVDGKEVFTCVPNYSVRQYCINQLNKTPDDNLKRMISDLLVYGEKTQLYQNYKTDALVTDGLELTPSNFTALDESYNKQQLLGEKDQAVRYSSATLSLSNDIVVLLGITTDDPTPYTFEITINGKATVYTAEDLGYQNGKYYLSFRGIKATAFDDVITAVIKKDGVQIGQALNYSVCTYIQKNQNTENQLLADLLKAIYNYGKSAKLYTK